MTTARMTDEILAAIARATPAMEWLATAGTPERRAEWAVEDAEIAAADARTIEAPFIARMREAARSGDYAALEQARAEMQAAMLAHFPKQEKPE